MSCEKYRVKINEYLDGQGELPEEHVAECAECARALDELRRLRTVLSSLPAEPAPAAFRQAVMGRVRERVARKAGVWETLRAAWWSRTAAATAAVAAVALVALHLNQAPVAAVPTIGDGALAEMANMHTQVQVAYVVPADSPAPKGDTSKPAKDEFADLYQTDGM